MEVGNPGWMSGGVTVLGGLVLSYNRLVIIGFALAVVALVWVLLNHTRLGLFVRAITQNRRMADCTGVPTGRVDMLAFGLGSGIAGLAGVALSQLGNVGPDLGAATSSIRSWWWCWAAWASWPAPSSPRWAWAASTNSWNPMRERSWPRSPSWRLSLFVQKRPQACSPRAAGASNEARRAGSAWRCAGRCIPPRLGGAGHRRRAAGAAAAANLAYSPGHPLHVSSYAVALLGKFMCYALAALALDLVWGYAGIRRWATACSSRWAAMPTACT